MPPSISILPSRSTGANTAGIAADARTADTTSPLPDVVPIAVAVRLPAADISARVTRRVDEQFERGLLDEIRQEAAVGLLAVPRAAAGAAEVVHDLLEPLEAVAVAGR